MQNKSFRNYLILCDAFTLARRSECYTVQILPNSVHWPFPAHEYLQIFFKKKKKTQAFTLVVCQGSGARTHLWGVLKGPGWGVACNIPQPCSSICHSPAPQSSNILDKFLVPLFLNTIKLLIYQTIFLDIHG